MHNFFTFSVISPSWLSEIILFFIHCFFGKLLLVWIYKISKVAFPITKWHFQLRTLYHHCSSISTNCAALWGMHDLHVQINPDWHRRWQCLLIMRLCHVCSVLIYNEAVLIFNNTCHVCSVLIAVNDVVKISDFGTSREWTENSTKMSFAGTVAWMAPEVIRNEPCSEKVDVWWDTA